jgi:hypothetical protein
MPYESAAVPLWSGNTQRRRWRSRWVAVTLLVVGFGLLASAPARWQRLRESERIQHGPSVTAFVVSSKVRTVGFRYRHRDTDYTVSFTNPDGGQQERAVVTRTYAADPAAAGRLLQISFDRSDPRHAEITGHPANTERDFWLILAGALAFLGAAVWHLRVLRPGLNP